MGRSCLSRVSLVGSVDHDESGEKKMTMMKVMVLKMVLKKVVERHGAEAHETAAAAAVRGQQANGLRRRRHAPRG